MKADKRKICPRLENLESRELLSWTPGSIPHNIAAPGAGFSMVNYWYGNGNIQNNGFNSWTFSAEHSGTYTFNVTGKPTTVPTMNGPITTDLVPIYALYNSKGQELWYAQNGGSSVIVNAGLTQGQKYQLWVTNLAGRYNGAFTVSVTGGAYTVNLTHNDGAGCNAGAEAYLTGNTLSMWLYAFNSSTWYWYDKHTDYFTVDFENAQNHVLCSEQVWCTTNYSQSYNHTYTFNISGWNLNGFTHFQAFLN